jgi:hypothetical protein
MPPQSSIVHPFLIGLLRRQPLHPWMPLLEDRATWVIIAAQAVRHGLSAFFYQWASERGEPRLPADLMAQLKAHVARVVARNLLLAQELASILQAVASAQVLCLPLRGLALAEQLYGSVMFRPAGDLDLLVPRDSIRALADVLTARGFRHVDRRAGFAQDFYYTLSFMKNRHGWIIVEPHWTITYPPFVNRIDMSAVWDRCHRTVVLGVETWRLGSEDLFLHLSLHLIHGGEQAPLLWLYELDRLIRSETGKLDWGQVGLLARQTGQNRLLAEVFRRLKDTFDSPIPADLVLELETAPLQQMGLGGSLESRLVQLLAGRSRLSGREQFALLFTIPGFWRKLRYSVSLLFPSPQYMRVHYELSTRRQLYLGYVLRTLRLGWQGLRWLVQLLIPVRALRRSTGQ